jgi:hypothetical protein
MTESKKHSAIDFTFPGLPVHPDMVETAISVGLI